jgi:glycosyltransferase involved in cell wall biosynthesis
MLLTNLSLSARSGTEMFTRDVALELLRRGHLPTVYTPLPGVLADELGASGVRVVSDLANEPAPHVIHGHHHVETMTAVLRFPGVPAVFVVHDRTAWHDRPPLHQRVRARVAVDESCAERFAEEGFARSAVRVIPNAVDLARFRPRGPLPPRPARALLFSHYAADHTHLPAVREACARAGLTLDVAGRASGNLCDRPEELLGAYDLVFAKARCALEAMAVGCAVVLCDHAGTGPLVRADQWGALRTLNFGRRTCERPLTAGCLLEQVARYDPADAAEVCLLTRTHAGVAAQVDEFLAVYGEAVRAQACAGTDPEYEARAAAEYLRTHLSYRWATGLAAARQCALSPAAAEAAHRGWAELHREYERVLAVCRQLRTDSPARARVGRGAP